MRVMCTALHAALLEKLAEKPRISVVYGARLARITEDSTAITATFADRTTARADVLFGCDGIRSVVRSLYVEPARAATYTGVRTVYSLVLASEVPVHWHGRTAVSYTAGGTLFTSYANAARQVVYVAAVALLPAEELAGAGARDGGRVHAHDDIVKGLLERFNNIDPRVAGVKQLIERAA